MLYDCRQRKRRKTTQSNPAFPSIHVHNHLPGSSARINTDFNAPETPPPSLPALPITVVKRSTSTPSRQSGHLTQLHHQPIIDLTATDSDDDHNYEDLDDIRYPGISTMLAELQREYPALTFPRYKAVLTENGFAYINQLIGDKVGGQLEALGIPIGVVNLLLSRAERLMRRAQKLKQED